MQPQSARQRVVHVPVFLTFYLFIFFLLPCSPAKVTAGPASGQPSVSDQSREASCHRHSLAPLSSTVHSPARLRNTWLEHTTSLDRHSTSFYLITLHVGNWLHVGKWLCLQNSKKTQNGNIAGTASQTLCLDYTWWSRTRVDPGVQSRGLLPQSILNQQPQQIWWKREQMRKQLRYATWASTRENPAMILALRRDDLPGGDGSWWQNLQAKKSKGQHPNYE